jgi:hypothetical protein
MVLARLTLILSPAGGSSKGFLSARPTLRASKGPWGRTGIGAGEALLELASMEAYGRVLTSHWAEKPRKRSDITAKEGWGVRDRS